MATHSTKQKRAKRGSPESRKDSSTPNTSNDSAYKGPTAEVTQSSIQQDYFNVPRKWPMWPNLDALAQKTANVATAPDGNWNAQLTPMERWRMESAQQSPWNNVGAVNTSSESHRAEFGQGPKDGSQGGDTDNGTWWP